MPTNIEWTDETWNPVTGCTPVSEGCQHCYAERMARRLGGRCGYPMHPHHFNVKLRFDKLYLPGKWHKPRKIFVCSMGDLFHEDVPFGFIHQVWDVMEANPQHIFQVLTKRPQRMKDVLTGEGIEEPGIYQLVRLGASMGFWDHVWLGVTAENQETANERIPVLLNTPAAVRFVSVEPMLQRVDFSFLPECGAELDQVLCGAETGPEARLMKLSDARYLRDQCRSAGVPFFMKKVSGGIHGKQPPDDLMIREYPNHKGR